MKLFNYLKLFGGFTDGYQPILVAADPKDRQVKKMLEEAYQLLHASTERRIAFLEKRATAAGEAFDAEAEKAAAQPKVVDGQLAMPLQYVQDYMIRKMAAVQNNVSIHDTKDVAELREVFDEYGVEVVSSFKGLIFDFINWTAKPGQKPKLLVHCKDAGAEEVVIRFEAAGELCQKFLNAAIALKLKPGQLFDLTVEAVDPAIERNKKAGKQVAELGRFVNHNLMLVVGSTAHTGHPPKGTKFIQKPTLESMETLFRDAQAITQTAGTA